MAEGLLPGGRYLEGLSHVTKTLALAAKIEERWYLRACIGYVGNSCFISTGRPRTLSRPASDRRSPFARQLRAKGWELLAATNLARPWAESGHRSEASELLAPICDWFTGGFDMSDLREARGAPQRARINRHRHSYIRNTPLPVVWVSNRR